MTWILSANSDRRCTFTLSKVRLEIAIYGYPRVIASIYEENAAVNPRSTPCFARTLNKVL